MQKIKELFYDYGKYFKKFWVFQVVISLLGIMVTWPLTTYAEMHKEMGIIPYVFAFVFCGGMFCFLVYDTFFQIGQKEAMKVQSKTIKYEPFKGIKIVLVPYSITLIVIVAAIIFKLCNIANAYAVTSVILNIAIHAMYSGLFFAMPDFLSPLALLLSALFTIASAFLGYFIAVNNKTLRGIFGIPVKTNKE